MTKTGVQEYVKKVMEAPSCCPEAKAACEAYLTAREEGEGSRREILHVPGLPGRWQGAG